MLGIGYPDYIPYDFETYNSIFVFEDGSKIKCSFCRMQVRRTLVWNFQPPNAWVSRATAKPPTAWARLAEQPAPSQAKNAAAVASAAPFVRAGSIWNLHSTEHYSTHWQLWHGVCCMSFFCSSRFLIEDRLFSPISLKESTTDIAYTRDELQIRL
jgi:hypothetical protein